MLETTWFVLIVWVIMLIFGFKYRRYKAILAIAGIVGMFVGIASATDIPWFGLMFIFFNMYILYIGLFDETKK